MAGVVRLWSTAFRTRSRLSRSGTCSASCGTSWISPAASTAAARGAAAACTVVIDGRAVRSCQTALAECTGKPITTIEGLERDGKLHPLQEAFLTAGGPSSADTARRA